MKKINLTYIVDDDEIILYLAEKIIKKSDFSEKLEKFSNGKSALERLKFSLKVGENVPDVIMFDLNMPEMNGWEFIKQLNAIFEEENVHIPTFIFTSSIDPADLERSYSFSNVKGYIPKPLTTIKLDKILRLIDSKELINNGSLKYYNYNQLKGY